MPIVLNTQANVAVAPGVATEILDALVGREAFVLHLQAPGVFWIRFGATAAIGSGIPLKGKQTINSWDILPGRLGTSLSSYEGAVSILWEGGTEGSKGRTAPLTTANIWVVEMTSS